MSKLFSKSRSALSIVLVLCLLALMLPAGLGALVAKADDAPSWDGKTYELPTNWDEDGAGSADNPYQIGNAAQLALLAAVTWYDTTTSASNGKKATIGIGAANADGGYDETVTFTTTSSYGWFKGQHFVLTNDIDVSAAANWLPIGSYHVADKVTYANAFCGSFDGAGYTVSGVTVTAYDSRTSAHPSGLFGYVSGYKDGGVTIENLHVTGTLTKGGVSWNTPGGIVGYCGGNGTLTIKNCSFEGNINTATSGAVGGIVGSGSGATLNIENCYYSGILGSATWSPCAAGGLVGYYNSTTAPATLNITNSHTTGTIKGAGSYTGTRIVGGLVANFGSSSILNITNCYSDMSITQNGSGGAGGGLVGVVGSSVTIENSYFAGTITTKISDITVYPIVPAATAVTASNVYYLDDTLTDDGVDGTTAATAAQFAGTASENNVADLLNENDDSEADVWMNWSGYNYPIFYAETPDVEFSTNLSFVDGNALKLSTNGDFTFTATPKNEETTVTVKVDGTELPATEYTYTVSVGVGKTVVVTIDTSLNGFDVSYTVTLVDNRWDGTTAETLVANADGEYDIWTAAQLAGLAASVNSGTTYIGKTINLCADLDLCNESWDPIGWSGNTRTTATVTKRAFQGTFNGGGHTITGLNYDRELYTFVNSNATTPEDLLTYKLFSAAELEDAVATLKEQGWELYNEGNSDIGTYYSSTPKTAQTLLNGVHMCSDGCEATASSCGKAKVYAVTGNQRDSYGVGLFGRIYAATIQDLNVEGSVETDQYRVGGLVGAVTGISTIKNCSFTGNVKAGTGDWESDLGGLIGSVESGTVGSTTTVTGCSFNGTITSVKSPTWLITNIVGTVGENVAIAEDGVSTSANISGSNSDGMSNGGLIGYVTAANVTVTDSYADVTVVASASSGTGGLVGTFRNAGASAWTLTVDSCYTAGTISGQYAGGLVGATRVDPSAANSATNKMSVKIKNSYSVAALTGTASSGLFGGQHNNSTAAYRANVDVTIENCHYAGNTVKYPVASTNKGTWTTTGFSNVYYPNTITPLTTNNYENVTFTVDTTDYTYSAEAKSVAEFADGTVTKALNGDSATPVWATSVNGYPVLSDAAATLAAIFPEYDELDIVVNGETEKEPNYATNIRADSYNGIRFKFAVSEDVTELDGLTELGVVMAKQGDSSAEADDLRTNLYLGAADYAKKQGKFDLSTFTPIVSDKGSCKQIWATLQGFADTADAYKKVYFARAYAKYTDADGQELIVYGDEIGAKEYYTSVYDSARALWDDQDLYAKLSDEQKVYVDDVLAKCETAE